jgi:hypothetical protein
MKKARNMNRVNFILTRENGFSFDIVVIQASCLRIVWLRHASLLFILGNDGGDAVV